MRCLAALLVSVSCSAISWAQSDPGTSTRTAHWTTTVQTGLADTFQLTLGGTFGQGPAWQSRIETGVKNVWTEGDSVYAYGTESLDRDSVRSDWQAGVGYRRPLWHRGRQRLMGSAGLQHWKFANVLTGANDWLTYENLTFHGAAGPVGFLATSDSWSLLKSPLPGGSLVHTQFWFEHVLLKREGLGLVFRHGPSHTYSWDFYGTRGNRVIRYQTMLGVRLRGVLIEGGYRQQFGLQPRIPDNSFWQFSIARTFTHW